MARGDLDAGQSSRRIGRYEVLGEIASGGMATVFLARSFGAKGFSRLVAIKRLHPHLEAEEDFVQMFLDEARLAARIRHPNVVATLDVEDSDGLYIVMEYVEGVTMLMLSRAAARANERTPVPVIVRMLLDTLAGMQAAHELTDDDGNLLGLVHRDISPQNILIGSDGTARLTDFGIAKAASRLTVTRDGQLKGKISYMAPEQTKRVEIDRRVDVFAMGIVSWELFTAKRLFSGDSDVEVLNHLLFEPIPTLREHVPAVPAVIEQVVMKALERDPTRRHGSAHEFADALERAAKMLGGPANHRTVAAFVQKVAGDRIARERGRIATGAPPGTDGNSTGSFRAQDGGAAPSSRVRTGNAPAAKPQDPFGPPSAARPAASPLSAGRYNAPAAGSGPRKSTGALSAEPVARVDDGPFDRRSIVRAPTIAAPTVAPTTSSTPRQADPKPTISGLGAPPSRPLSGPPSARASAAAPALTARPPKSTIIGMGNAVPSVSPTPAARTDAARASQGQARGATAKPIHLTFGSNEFDEEMPTLAETGAAPKSDEIAFESGGMESTLVDAEAVRAVPVVSPIHRRPQTLAAAPLAASVQSPRKSTGRAANAPAEVAEEIPELLPDSDPPPSDARSDTNENLIPPSLMNAPRAPFFGVPNAGDASEEATPAFGHPSIPQGVGSPSSAPAPAPPAQPPRPVPVASVASTLPMPALAPPASLQDPSPMSAPSGVDFGLSPADYNDPAFRASMRAPTLAPFIPVPARRGPPIWLVALLLLIVTASVASLAIWLYLTPQEATLVPPAHRSAAPHPVPLARPPPPRTVQSVAPSVVHAPVPPAVVTPAPVVAAPTPAQVPTPPSPAPTTAVAPTPPTPVVLPQTPRPVPAAPPPTPQAANPVEAPPATDTQPHRSTRQHRDHGGSTRHSGSDNDAPIFSHNPYH